MQRIQKFLAQSGIGSRRAIESWIKLGRIKINDKIAVLGTQVTGSEEFKLDNKILSNKSGAIKTILYHKPAGKICTRSDPKNRPTVFEDLPQLTVGRWVVVGRLDFNTSGLLLFTNNGDLAHKLMHPSFNQEREYMVRIFGTATNQILSLLTKGIELEDGIAKFKKITFVNQKNSNSWYKVILTEGKNREIKRLFASQGLEVNRLVRIRFGHICLPRTLKAGEFEYLENFI